MIRTFLILCVLVAVAANAAAPTAHSPKQSGKPQAAEPARRSPGVLTESQETEDLNNALKDFYEVTGQSNGTGEQSGWSPRSMQEASK